MSLALRFGRSVAAPTPRQVERFGNVSRIDDARARAAGRAQVGRGRGPVGFSPRQTAGVGADCNGPQATPPGSTQAWCYNMQGAEPIPIGSGRVQIPAAVGNVAGVGNLTLQPVEAFTMEDVEITDPTGEIMFDSIKAGRCDFIEAGQINSQKFAPNNTGCKMFRGFNIYPNSGLVFHAINPTAAPVTLSITGSGRPIPCPQGQA